MFKFFKKIKQLQEENNKLRSRLDTANKNHISRLEELEQDKLYFLYVDGTDVDVANAKQDLDYCLSQISWTVKNIIVSNVEIKEVKTKATKNKNGKRRN